MSIMMSMDLDQDLKKPSWFSVWYSQVLPEYIYEFTKGPGAVPNYLGKLTKHFDIKISALLKVAGQDFPIEEFGNKKQMFEKYKKYNQSCWQSPQKLIDCLKVFVNKIDDEPEVFSQLQIEDHYFLRGEFKQDLLDLIRMAEWANANGATKIKLWCA